MRYRRYLFDLTQPCKRKRGALVPWHPEEGWTLVELGSYRTLFWWDRKSALHKRRHAGFKQRRGSVSSRGASDD